MPLDDDLDDPGDALMDSLVQVSFAVTAVLSQLSARHDLSLTQLRVLAILRDHQPTMARLADHLGLDRSTVSGLIDRASARGLVRRLSNPSDGRSSHVALTSEGQAFAAVLADESRAAISPLLSALSATERTSLTTLLSHALAHHVD